MIDVLIFSKNRACQLDLLLRSIYDNFPMFKFGAKMHILFKADSDEYDKGYRKLMKNGNLNLIWHEEDIAFKDEVMQIVHGFDEPHTLCFVDDDVVIKSVNVISMLQIFDRNPEVNALSLRMGKHINYCYAKDTPQQIPEFIMDKEKVLKWNWVQAEHDWGYPMSLAGNIYRTEELVPLWEKLPFNGPNYIEGYMAMNAPADDRPFQITYAYQRVYNIANNLVQTVCKNRHADKPEDAPEVLNELYLKGFRIQTSTLYGKSFNCANGEAEYILKKV